MPDPIEIQFWLRKRGKTQRDVARHLGVSEAAVSQVINRKCRSKRIEKIIARWTGFRHNALFPEIAA